MAVLELGARTGVITKAILEREINPHQLVSVEYSPAFYGGLTQRFPGVDFRLGDAFALNDVLGNRKDEQFDCVASTVPLLSFPMERRVALLWTFVAGHQNAGSLFSVPLRLRGPQYTAGTTVDLSKGILIASATPT